MKHITIASRQPGFHWAGRPWDTEPVLVCVAEDDEDAETGAAVRITPAAFAELQRQCQYSRFPLHIGKAGTADHNLAEARDELAEIEARIEAERRALDELKAEKEKAKRHLESTRARLATGEKELAQAKDALAAAEARAQAAEAQLGLGDVQVEDLPDKTRERR